MLNVRIDETTLLVMLADRVRFWNDDPDVVELFTTFYESEIFNGCFDNAEIDINCIVDNDYVNYFMYGTAEELAEMFDDFDEMDAVAEYNGLMLYPAC